MGFLPHDLEAAKAAVLAEKCPCPCPTPDANNPGAKMALAPILAILEPFAAQAVAQFGPAVVSFLESAAEQGMNALIAKLGGGTAPAK